MVPLLPLEKAWLNRFSAYKEITPHPPLRGPPSPTGEGSVKPFLIPIKQSSHKPFDWSVGTFRYGDFSDKNITLYVLRPLSIGRLCIVCYFLSIYFFHTPEIADEARGGVDFIAEHGFGVACGDVSIA